MLILSLTIPFLPLSDLLQIRSLNHEGKELVNDLFEPTKKKFSFLQKIRSIENKEWANRFRPYQGSVRMVWEQSLPPLFPRNKWTPWLKMVSYFASPWLLKKRGLSTLPLFEYPKTIPLWRIRFIIHLEELGEEDILGIGVSTSPSSQQFIGMDGYSFGYYLDDGLLCQDSCILHKMEPTKVKEDIFLEIDYQQANWSIYQNGIRKFTNPFYGDFLYKRLYIVITGEIKNNCKFQINVCFFEQ